MEAIITRTVRLAAPAAEVWRAATRLDDINLEMAPWLRMTAPAAARDLSLDDPGVVPGQELFVSRVLLLGVVPIERLRVTIVELERGRRFVEESPMLAMRRWRHERTVEPEGAGCRVEDRVRFAPLVAAATPLVRAALEWFFAHRHRNLVRRFGAAG